MIFFEFGPVVREKMQFKDMFYLELRQPLCWWSGTICAILIEGITINISVIFLNLDKWVRRSGGLKTFLI